MYQVLVLTHVLSAMIWVGGLLFLVLVAVPVARTLPASDRAALLDALGRRFRVIGWICVVVLLTSGTVLSAYRGITWEALLDGAVLASSFGRLLTIKVALVMAMVVVSLVHDLWLGPTSTRLLADTTATDLARARVRRASAWTARASLLFGLAIVFLAVSLVRGLP
jgi:uncharacterized membrane protein